MVSWCKWGIMEIDIKTADLSILNDLRDEIAKNAERKGFKEPPPGISPELWASEKWAHIRMAVYTANEHGEVSEMWESARAGTLGKPCDKSEKMVALGLDPLTCAEEEIADIIIRAFDTAHEFGVDIAKAVRTKMLYNASRPLRHGGKLA